MKLLYTGKTKNIYELDEDSVRLKFKDDVTGVDGVFDPGANGVGLQISGIGNLGLQVTSYLYKELSDVVPTHFISSNFEENTMDVKRCKPFGHGLEVICRLVAGGSFVRRYGAYINEGEPLDYFVEFTIKDDKRNDPPISEDGLVMLNILSHEDYKTLVDYTKKITHVIKELFAKKGIVLQDIKYEFGKTKDEIVLMDEISAGSMRASIDGKIVDPIELSKLILG